MQQIVHFGLVDRLRVASNFGDSGEIHAHARAKMALLLAGAHFRARACISPESPKLETTRSLLVDDWVEELTALAFHAARYARKKGLEKETWSWLVFSNSLNLI